MKASSELVRIVRSIGWRLLLVIALAVVVAGGTYAVAVSPVGTSMASSARRPPSKPADAIVQSADAVTTGESGGTAATSDASTASQTEASQETQPERPPGADGGGRGPSLTRGLPELGMHAVVIGVIVLVLNGARSMWLMLQRWRGGNRAPIFHHAAAGK